MAKQILLKAVPRLGAGKSQVKKLRRQGMVPAVIYGPHTTPRNLAVRALDLERVLQSATGENVLVNLQVE
ncbi:MAG: 50S ribosomal protein L25, partial [Verrucomicrobiae bacterium]|nr:50S ribosomal protein L25 [Verrucomicrobiae bacterium]